jgi:Flp pilus assembly protein TadG
MKRRAQSERGAVVVEFAIVLPLFLILVFGVIEFGMIMYYKAVITNASREGARLGVLYSIPPATAAQVDARVRGFLAPAGIANDAQVTFPLGGPGATGTLFSVQVVYTYQFLVLPKFVTSLAPNLNLTAVTIMRME